MILSALAAGLVGANGLTASAWSADECMYPNNYPVLDTSRQIKSPAIEVSGMVKCA